MRDMPDKNTTHDFKGLTEWFPVFPSGTHKDSQGRERSWTNDELDEFIATHEAQLKEGGLYSGFPFVVGHPKTDDPAYAWGAGLKRDGDMLYAKGDKVEPQFESGVEKGNWPNRSVRIRKTKHGLGIAHVGFLGAARPAIEGMDALYSADDEAEHYDFEFAADSYTPSVVARIFRGIRNWFIEKEGVETADRLIPDYQIESLSEHATNLRESTAQVTPSFSAPDKGDTPNDNTGDANVSTFTQADIDAATKKGEATGKKAAEADFSASEQTAQQQLQVERDKNRKAEYVSFVAGLDCDPAKKEGWVEFMLSIDSAEDATFEFSAGDETVKKSPVQFVQDFLGNLKSSVDFNESDAGDDGSDERQAFSAPQGYAVDGDQLTLHTKALEYQAENPGTDYVTAVIAVNK